ncbi:ecdysis triggering hormone [Cochliomyia hominivorax]
MNFYYLIIYVAVLLVGIDNCKSDDSPGFFLKITKNVPRLGRRSDKEFESKFLKNYKIIPRMGRSSESDNKNPSLENWFNDETYLKQLDKRVLMPPRISVPERELSVVQPVNSNTLIELLDKDAIPSDNVKFVHWKDFDRALQLDEDLYGKVISLGRRPDQRLKQDLSIGSYLPLFNRGPMEGDGTDFMLYNRGADLAGNLNSDIFRYNRI